MINCPECGTKMSETASACPYCGYRTDAKHRPVKMEDKLVKIKWDEGLFSSEFYEVPPISAKQSKKLSEIFCDVQNLKRFAPALFDAVIEIVRAKNSKTVKVAELLPEAQKLLDEGILEFKLDKNGEVLPCVYNTLTKKIGAQVRLRDLQLTPDMISLFSDLPKKISMWQMINMMLDVQKGVGEIKDGQRDDRLAEAESIWQQFHQASKISDTRFRDSKIQAILASATESKCTLMKAFEGEKKELERKYNRKWYQHIFDLHGQKNSEKQCMDLFTYLLAITKVVQVETTAYCVLDAPESANVCLVQFRNFINKNGLNDRGTLLELNSFSKRSLKTEMIIDYFSDIENKFDQLSLSEPEESTLLIETMEVFNE